MQQEINNKIITYLATFNPDRIGIFGSYARNEDSPHSDIDILVDFSTHVTLFDLGGIKYDLSEILQRPVDIVTGQGLNNRIRNSVNKDLKIIFSR
jgi:uncharacterized protein